MVCYPCIKHILSAELFIGLSKPNLSISLFPLPFDMRTENIEMANMSVQDTSGHAIPNAPGEDEQPSIQRQIKEGITKVITKAHN